MLEPQVVARPQDGAREVVDGLVRRIRSAHPATISHVLSLLLAVAFILWIDRDLWFLWDDWWFLSVVHSAVQAGDWTTVLLAPYASHWIAIPNLVYEGIYQLVGLRSYTPYLLALLAGHVALVVLIRIAMRRAGVGPWLATGMALLLLVPGFGGWGVTLVAMIVHAWALLFVLGQLLLTDHPGRIDRRDFLGLGLGMLGLLCGNSALPMILAVGLNLALRGRRRAAALAVLPPLTQFTIWYVAFGIGGVHQPSAAEIAQVPTYVWTGLAGALEGISALSGSFALMVVGLLAAAAYLRLSPRTPGLSAVYSMAAGGLVFYTLAGIGRVQFGANIEGLSRYAYVGTVFFLPFIAAVIAASARDRRAVPVVAGLLVWAVIQHVGVTYTTVGTETARGQALKHKVLQAVAKPNFDILPPQTPIESEGGLFVTVGVIQHIRAEGQFPN